MRIIFLLVMTTISTWAQGQLGGSRTFAFLDLPSSARVAALGGQLPVVLDGDPWTGEQNPALLNSQMHAKFATTLVNYLADIQYGHSVIHYSDRRFGSFQGGLRYINYGVFAGRDVFGRDIGNFTAGDRAWSLGWGRQIYKGLRIGIQAQYITSRIDGWTSNGLALSLGAAYQSKDSVWVISAQAKNFGWQLKSYSGSTREPLPFDLQLGMSVKPKHMPIRFSITGIQLQNRNLSFIDPSRPKQIDANTGEEVANTIGIPTKIFNHMVVGTEFVFGKAFQLRFGLNPRMRREMQLVERRGMVGFSWGMGLQIKRLGFSYGSTVIHTGQPTHLFSLMLDAKEIAKGKKWKN